MTAGKKIENKWLVLAAVVVVVLGGGLFYAYKTGFVRDPFKITNPADPRFDPAKFRFEDYFNNSVFQFEYYFHSFMREGYFNNSENSYRALSSTINPPVRS